MNLEQLEPRHVWGHFDRIRSIPRPSKREERIREHLMAWARERGFAARADKVGNTVISVPASKGRESAPVLVLQAHMDMVCEKNAGVTFDFEKDAIQLQRDGDWLKAKGTTLGADNGVGLAAALALADDPEVVHGPLEILVTVDEETGLTGAAELDASMVTGRRLLNLDTEELGAIYIGCSGGGNTTLTLPITRAAAPSSARTVIVTVSGLRGGHSGMDIVLQRGNAVAILARILRRADTRGSLRLESISGGNAHNAIPREARASCCIPAGDLSAFSEAAQAEGRAIAGELGNVDPGLTVLVETAPEKPGQVADAASHRRLLAALLSVPYGVEAMSLDVPGLVETSSNLAAVRTEGDTLQVLVSVRSSIRSALMSLRDRVHAVAEMAGGSHADNQPYPGWKPDLGSAVLKVARAVHARELGSEPELKAVHAGLECGVIGEKLPGIDMISIGPWIESPHSPDERINIPSVVTFWKYLKALVAELAA